MTRTISELWEGIIEPNRPLQAKETQMRHTLHLAEEQHMTLVKSLNEAQKETFDKYRDCQEDYSLLLSEQAFCDGFSLGLRLAAEAFINEA